MTKSRIQPLLVVEDSDEDYVCFERVIRKLSLQTVYRCTNGDEALDFLRRTGNYQDHAQAPRPAMILLDLNLPGTDGREVLEEVKQDVRLKMIPIVIFTTSDDPKDVDVCYRYGANGYVVKPVNTPQLIRTIQVIVDYWLEANRLPSLTGGL